MSFSKNIWVLAEQREGRIEDVSLELVSNGRLFADELKEELYVVLFGSSNTNVVAVLANYGADKVYFINSPLSCEYYAELYVYVETLSKLIEKEKPAIILFGATLFGADLASRLAARLKAALVSDCISLALNEDRLLLQTKLTYGGKVATTIVCPTSVPQMATVKSGVMGKKKPTTTREPKVKVVRPQFRNKEIRCRTRGYVKAAVEMLSLDEVDVIVAGGRGVGSANNFQLLSELAKRLGGLLAGSLAAVDEGWIPRNRLVGQTGMTVMPQLYIACGISGASHHIIGMKDSKAIVAINKDRDAPIFGCADMCIVGDVQEVVAAITNRLRELAEGTTRHKNEAIDDREI